MYLGTELISSLTFKSLEILKYAVYWIRKDGKFIYVNNFASIIHQMTNDKLLNSYVWDIDPFVKEEDFPQIFENVKNKPQEFESMHLKNDGSLYPVLINSTYYTSEELDVIICISNDISKLKKSEELIYYYEKIIATTEDLMSFVDRDYKYIVTNDSYCKTFNLKKDEIIGKTISDILGKELFEKTLKEKFDKAILGEKISFEMWNNITGKDRYIAINYLPYINNLTNEIEGVIIHVVDKTTEKSAMDKISFFAEHDVLTEVLNKRYFYNKAEQSISFAKRNNFNLAFLFIDLDKFKSVNDIFGHQVGDKLLIEVVNRISQRIRKEDSICRSGGDEFLILLENISSLNEIEKLTNDLLKLVRSTFVIDNNTINISASIGISIYPDDSDNLRELIAIADSFMYKAKKEGKNKFYKNKKDFFWKKEEKQIGTINSKKCCTE